MARAFVGYMIRADKPLLWSGWEASFQICVKTGNIKASVFPVPVGATITMSAPLSIKLKASC